MLMITTLPNKLRIVTDPMADAQSVALGLWVGVGTRDEPDHLNGIAHMTEHMLFKGTEKRTAFALSAMIEKKGGALNAYTTREETAYYARVLPEDTATAMDVLSDMILNSTLPEKEMKRERQVILQEIGRDRDAPEDHICELASQASFPDQKIGRSILGEDKIVRKIEAGQIKTYMKKHYGAQNMVLVASGHVEHDKIVQLAETYFSALPSSKTKSRKKAFFKGREIRCHKEAEQLHLTMSFSGVRYKHPDHHKIILLSLILAGNSSSRLFQKIREKRGLVYAISAWHEAFSDTGMFTVYAGTDPVRANELMPVLCEELLATTEKITPSELNRAKAQLRADLLMGQESVMRRAETLGTQMLVYNRPRNLEKMLKKISALTPQDIEKTAHKLFSHKPAFCALGNTEHLEPYKDICERLKQ